MPRNERLRQVRIQRNWHQKDVADRLGASLLTVQRWELGIQQPSSYFATKLCDLFGLSPQELGLGDTDNIPHSPALPNVVLTSSEQIAPPSSTLWTIPHLRNPYFTGRDDLFGLLDEHLTTAKQHENVSTCRVALTGLGGIGKTQLAVEYAYRKQGQYLYMLWINAASQEALMTSFIALANLLPEFPAKKETDQQKLVDAIKRWLEECTPRWLLIFDNADDLSLLSPYVPRYGNGGILLTTRAQAVGSLAITIDIENMSLEEGTRFVLRRTQHLTLVSDEEVNIVRKLVVALGSFPLALEQAAAYVEETGCSFDHYLHLYHYHRGILFARSGANATSYPHTVATAWSLSFQSIQQNHPAAAQLLQLCAFLAPDSIPEELILDGAMYWPMLLQQAVADAFSFDQLLAALLRFSLIKHRTKDRLLNIHRLVQIVQVEMLDAEEQRQWAERVVRAINRLFPPHPREDVPSWSQCLRYLGQVQACSMLIQQHQLQLAEAADLLDRAGTYLLHVHGDYCQAEAYYLQALTIKKGQLGSQHLETAKTLHNLGCLCFEQGKYEQAESYYQQALTIKGMQLEDQHLETAKTLNNLGVNFYRQGKYEQAESYYQQALTIKEGQLGSQHLATASTLNNLGILYTEQEKYEQAENYFRRALAICEERLGNSHPLTTEIMTNLAILYLNQHEHELAEPLFAHALMTQECTLTVNSPKLAKNAIKSWNVCFSLDT